ncbi:BREX system ATP-binding domain-containing protein [Streptomyces sp. NPDC086554]|uniref:helix-turn-helix transcriptional regulator n=1 Tax=Streptomyces sp. NPDC086554 TaxID=3154864 RepID=UPI00342EC506
MAHVVRQIILRKTGVMMNLLVGRENALSALGRHLDSTAQGGGGCVVVDGPLGTGKTRLLQATALEAAERGLAVAAGRASGTHRTAPIHLLINLLQQVMPGEADFDDLVRPGRNPFWLIDRMGRLVETAARRHPLVIVLDDAQQVDDVNGLVLRELVRSLASSPVFWLLSRRPDPTSSMAQHAIDWLADHSAVRLYLGALDNEAVAELCTSVLGAKPDSSALSWAARCGGNPLLVESLFSALVQAGEVIIVNGTASVAAERMPKGVLTAVGRLLDEVPAAVRRLLVCGGRIGRSFTVEEAAAMLGESALDLSPSADLAVREGLMRKEGRELTFAHEVVGEALQEAAFQESERSGVMASAESSAMPSAASSVVPSTAPPSSPAPRSPLCGCDTVVARAVSALHDLFDEAPRTLARAVHLLAGAGQGTEAGRLTDIALRPAAYATAAADTAQPAPTPTYCGTCERPLWTWLVRGLVAADQFEEAAAVCAVIKQEAEKPGEPWSEALWYGHRAEVLAAEGRLEEARVEAEKALRPADRSAPEDSVPARLVVARISLHNGDLATAGEQLRATERLVTGDASADRARLDWVLARFHAASGRPAMTVRSLISPEGHAPPDPLLFAEVPTAAATLVHLAVQAGLGAEARRAADLARRTAERNPGVWSLAAGAEHAEGVLRDDTAALHHAAELYRLAGRPLAAGLALEDAARVQKKPRHLGMQQVRGPGAELPKSGWESLTGAELRVVQAIVDGKTNREAASVLFLSPHTVDSHLRRVFSKLDINSRVELTKHFIAHEAFPPAMATSHRCGSAS